MPTFTCNVAPRVRFTPDGNGKYLLTPEKLNDAANPAVSVTITDAQLYPAVTITVESAGSTKTLTLQATLGGESLSRRLRLEMWLSENTSTYGISSNEPDTPGTGFVGNQCTIVTGSDGSYSFDITHSSTAKTWYLCVASPTGIVYISEALVFS